MENVQFYGEIAYQSTGKLFLLGQTGSQYRVSRAYPKDFHRRKRFMISDCGAILGALSDQNSEKRCSRSR